jgi:hypothetical protein
MRTKDEIKNEDQAVAISDYVRAGRSYPFTCF